MHTNCAEDHLYLKVCYEAADIDPAIPLDTIARVAIETFRGTDFLQSVSPAKLDAPAPYAVQFIGTGANSHIYDVFWVNPATLTATYVASVAIRKLYNCHASNMEADAVVYNRRLVAVPRFRPMHPQEA
ncbi:MAG: hypothetical protein EON60_06970 [Alphaproteobacteria bacterium]|nr:MAG: hypothetical protein EON60_06970 [Alphaproteobacteria bacterium]